ncbi:vacuolar amino acid permease [Roridomyces roridus]|uniref:Vacuolar amino acid permease n=1 Tax=Roridomyces roridus TaxID=1738132 RepID=A0AAD7B6D4_9AGAR|nr:vacuolar amino acid permease [Roridomyces roridus]
MASSPTERDLLLNKPVKSLGPLEISKSNRYGILTGIWLATFLGSLNATLVPTMIPAISSEFHQFHQSSWLGTAYLLAGCTFTPLYGRLCNVMGRKGANRMAITFAAIGAVGCGLSQDMNTLILARFIAGMGGGGIFTTSTIIVSDMYTLRDRGLAQSAASCFNGLGMGLGGLVGGLISEWINWRAAFLLQVPFYVFSVWITSYNLCYVTPGKSKSAKEILKRIDYFGILTLLISVASLLMFLSMKYNASMPWSDPRVLISLASSLVSALLFMLVEAFVASDPILTPSMLRQKVPVLVAISNLLVATCNFCVNYFFPVWFQVVMMQSAAVAGLHLAPSSLSMSLGSVFAGWMMHRMGRYKTINSIFGIFPFIGALLIYNIREDSGPLQSWLSVIPFGFGNAVVLQTNLIALLAHLPESQTALGTGFGQLFRGIGQVGGLAVASALFQTRLDTELRKRIHTPDAEILILNIRRSSQIIHSLNPVEQRAARDAYAQSLRSVYILAACATLLAYLVRIPIPDQDLDKAHARRHGARAGVAVAAGSSGSEDSDPDALARDSRSNSTVINKRALPATATAV